jgi:hypothetical protein
MVFSLTDQCLHHTRWKDNKKAAAVFDDTSIDTPTTPTVQHQHSAYSSQLFMIPCSYTSVSVKSVIFMSLYSRVFCDHIRSNLLKVDVIQRRLAVKAKVFMLVTGNHVDEQDKFKFLK